MLWCCADQLNTPIFRRRWSQRIELRAAVFEFIEMTRDMVEAMNHGEPAAFVQAGRRQMAGRTLRSDAVRLVCAGRTTIDEAMRISTQLDD